MAAQLRGVDWARTRLGPVQGWPASLRSVVRLALSSAPPMLVWWGAELVQIYNDALRPILGDKHPRSIAAPAADVWREIWPTIGPVVASVVAGGPAATSEHLRIATDRRGAVEEAYVTFPYSPIFDDEGAVGGLLVTPRETTAQVQAERQLRTLRDLASGVGRTKTAEDACRAAARVLESNAADIPFALVYLVMPDQRAELVAAAGLAMDDPRCPSEIGLDADPRATPWPLAATRGADPLVLCDLGQRCPAMPAGGWSQPPHSAVVQPLARAGTGAPFGYLVAGTSAARVLDDAYLDFIHLLGDRLAFAIANGRAHADERRRSEAFTVGPQAAETQRRTLYDLFMQAPDPICVMGGDDLVFEMANDAYRALFSGRELLGKRMLDAVPELAGQGYDELMHEVLRSGKTVTLRSAMARLQRGGKLGDTYWDFVYAPLRDAEGVLDRVMVLAHEITHEARARAELEQARRQAEKASRAKDEFLAMLGHELRNPLAPILTATELMDHHGGEVFERERAVIRRQLRHVVRLVDDLLDVSRITRGSIALERKPVELAVIAAKAIEQVSPLLGERRHALTSEVPTSGLLVYGDETRLAQVLANLLANAAKYTPAGGRIGVSAIVQDRDVRVTVRDNGVGISPGLLPHVFELFKQGEQGIDRARGGLGLGLAIAKAIVGLHGGRIEAASAGAGRGSEFAVTLPRMVEAPRASSQPPVRDDDRVEPRRVLVVDDNRDLVETVAELIACVGHDVTIAHDGLDAWAKLSRERFEVALLDIGLPGLSGYELVERIRADERLRDMQVIALTGYGGADARETAMTAGFDAYLVKPVDLAQLRVLIATGTCEGAHTRERRSAGTSDG